MKTKFFTIALLFAISLTGVAQNKASLEASTKKMIELKNHENYTELIGTFYPKIIENIPLEDYPDEQYKKLNGPDYTVQKIDIGSPINYGTIKKDDSGITFCVIYYYTTMTFKPEKKIDPSNIVEEEGYFNKQFDTKNALYSKKDNVFSFTKTFQVVAIADETTAYQWTFADTAIPGVYEILPEAIRKVLDTEKIPEVPATAEPMKNNETKDAKAKRAVEKEKLKAAQKS